MRSLTLWCFNSQEVEKTTAQPAELLGQTFRETSDLLKDLEKEIVYMPVADFRDLYCEDQMGHVHCRSQLIMNSARRQWRGKEKSRRNV